MIFQHILEVRLFCGTKPFYPNMLKAVFLKCAEIKQVTEMMHTLLRNDYSKKVMIFIIFEL